MASTANITWTAASGAVNYLVEYKKHSDSTYITAPGTNPTTGTSYSIPNLDSGTAYDFRITTMCSSGTGVATQQGNTPCIVVTGLGATFSGTTATVTFNRIPEAVSYAISYKLHSNPSYTTAPGSPLTNPGSGTTVNFNIASLSAGEQYDFQVVTNCNVGTSSGATTSATSACPAVTNVNVSFT